MRLVLVYVLSASFGLAAGEARAAATCDPTTVSDTRKSVAGTCDCATATSRKDYLKCVGGALKSAVRAKTLTHECAAAVRKCAAKSTCGNSSAVTCCETNAKGTTKCSIKHDAAACKGPHGGTACSGTKPGSCCDACTTSGCAS